MVFDSIVSSNKIWHKQNKNRKKIQENQTKINDLDINAFDSNINLIDYYEFMRMDILDLLDICQCNHFWY